MVDDVAVPDFGELSRAATANPAPGRGGIKQTPRVNLGAKLILTAALVISVEETNFRCQ